MEKQLAGRTGPLLSAFAPVPRREAKSFCCSLLQASNRSPRNGRWNCRRLKSGAPDSVSDLRLWLVMEECNLEMLPGSFYLEPQVPLGHLSRKFLLPLLKEFIQRRNQLKTVNWLR